MELPAPADLAVASLGEARIESPYRYGPFADERDRILVSADTADLEPFLPSGRTPPGFEIAGPRPRLFFETGTLTCGVVTCGGLCPGVNNVIRSIVLALTYGYGVRSVLGFRYGFAGLSPKSGHEPMALTLEVVESIHRYGGTLLGSSRGPQDVGEMVDTLVARRVGILFAIGGDGTLRGASAIVREIGKRKLPIAVVAIPKTIDNDIEWVERSFGFATAVEQARESIAAAHAEARGAWNGIGLVKLMGRHAGFIAAHATLASADVNFCLVPEAPFPLEGELGLFPALERRLASRHHAVVVVAEGAAQDVLQDPAHVERDPSGNLRLKDVGVFLRDAIAGWFGGRDGEVTVKYIDPSYEIRSLAANSIDSELCLMLGQHAVHAGMAGRTNVMIGYWNQHFTHVPIPLATAGRRQLDPRGDIWQRVLEATGQPIWLPRAA